MKIRYDFVSNSSSSSFVLLGKVMEVDEFVNCIKTAGFKQENNDDEDNFDLWNISNWVEDKTHKFLEVEYEGYDGDYYTVLIGAHPANMKDTDVLKDFKQKVIDELAKVGVIAKMNDIHFESGGSDSSGQSWIGECG